MLADVLLHVVEAALPVNRSVDRAGTDRPVSDVRDGLVRPLDVHYGGIAEGTGVVRLPA